MDINETPTYPAIEKVLGVLRNRLNIHETETIFSSFGPPHCEVEGCQNNDLVYYDGIRILNEQKSKLTGAMKTNIDKIIKLTKFATFVTKYVKVRRHKLVKGELERSHNLCDMFNERLSSLMKESRWNDHFTPRAQSYCVARFGKLRLAEHYSIWAIKRRWFSEWLRSCLTNCHTKREQILLCI